mmetsp:Transcript_1532/g.2164  ORF Transcript_1532/g.2164 Transcript_1532/m.2164 type:complete len:430 (+) Transcript_1532:122-1411(+)|eukprot:CAMPEP_0117041582 /NCGR_PEP_ID=MMETSP0472-20121206/29023_1 /TAXON_ID=693140 ORGANISM="Tiarina fusus, Strain LIS" /NCGR_SAMPLE_ID=MMETSP0472 /ASSEMBLY_ACC=CAM_ASM_000603 /LENGTH=429 /DNA_ID=CAMNT_0004752617 /DNA_START=105 /DNA_END=1394 /DNA_ORIENTATION=+
MRTKAARSAKKARGRKNNPKRNVEVPLEEVLKAAEAAATAFDIENGIQLYAKAASLLRQGRSIPGETREWQLVRILEKLGELKVSVGDQDGAVQDFREAIRLLEQEEKTLKFYDTYSSLSMYIGQLCVEDEARAAYEQGVLCLESCMKLAQQELATDPGISNPTINSQMQDLSRKLCLAYCAVAELYLTDLCYDEDAEGKCEAVLEKAMQIKDTDGEPLVDALQTMASLRLSQTSRRLEAAACVLRAYEKMRVGCEALAQLVGISEPKDINDSESNVESVELQNVDAASSLPEFEFRCQTAKLLLECADISKGESAVSGSPDQQAELCVVAAIAVLGSLLAENDEVVEIWFLSGCAFASKTPPQIDLAIYYLRRSMEMLLDIKKSLEQEAGFAEGEDKQEIEEQLAQNEALLSDVQSKLQQAETAATPR